MHILNAVDVNTYYGPVMLGYVISLRNYANYECYTGKKQCMHIKVQC